jgi:hypothetical protein
VKAVVVIFVPGQGNGNSGQAGRNSPGQLYGFSTSDIFHSHIISLSTFCDDAYVYNKRKN